MSVSAIRSLQTSTIPCDLLTEVGLHKDNAVWLRAAIPQLREWIKGKHTLSKMIQMATSFLQVDLPQDINEAFYWASLQWISPAMPCHYGRKIDIHSTNENGLTGLRVVLDLGKGDFVMALVELGADVNTVDSNQGTVLHFAAKMGLLPLAEIVVGKGASIEATTTYGKTPLDLAMAWNQNKIVKLLINHGADFHKKGALIFAASKGDLDLTELLISKHVDLDEVDNEGNSALMKAVLMSNLLIFTAILKAGANVNIQNKNLNSALHLCMELGEFQMVTLLIEHKADPLLKAKDDETPLGIGVLRTERHAIKSFLQAIKAHAPDQMTACLEAENNYEQTPFLSAVITGDLEIVQDLLNASPNVLATDFEGRNGLHLAAKNGHLNVVTFLALHIDLETKDYANRTAMHWAVLGGHYHTLDYLLKTHEIVHPDIKYESDLLALLTMMLKNYLGDRLIPDDELQTLSLYSRSLARLINRHGVDKTRTILLDIRNLLLERGASTDLSEWCSIQFNKAEMPSFISGPPAKLPYYTYIPNGDGFIIKA